MPNFGLARSGNKLSYLNGQILFKLPQLHALQLAGPTNSWRCDCRLRKLVRRLTHRADARGALEAQGAQTATNILQDEPRCAGAWPPAANKWRARADATGAADEAPKRSDDSIVSLWALPAPPDTPDESQQHRDDRPNQRLADDKLWTNMSK